MNLNGLLHVQVQKEFGDSTVAKILDLVENSSSKKAKAEHFITRFARYYTPAVVFAALALAGRSFPHHRAVGRMGAAGADVPGGVLPCALVISVPLTFFGGHRRSLEKRYSR